MKKLIPMLMIVMSGKSVEACLQHKEVHNKPIQSVIYKSYQAQGMASWYGPGFHGRKTANGERFNRYGLTAAHKTLPLGTKVKVTNKDTKQSIIVRINDRGPYVSGRLIDLSEGAAKSIGLKGIGQVKLASIR